jgi:hypothetical protein
MIKDEVKYSSRRAGGKAGSETSKKKKNKKKGGGSGRVSTNQSKASVGEEQQQGTSIMYLALDHQHFQSTRAHHANLCQHRHQIKRLTYMSPCDLSFIANRIQAFHTSNIRTMIANLHLAILPYQS